MTARPAKGGFSLHFMYGLALDSLLPNLDDVGRTPGGPWCARGALEYVDDITIILSDEGQVSCLEISIRRYEAVARAMEKSVGFQLGI